MKRMILIIFLFSYSLPSLIFKKGIFDEYKKEIITTNLKSITKLYDFKDITFESFNFKYKNNIYQITNITNKNVIYNITTIDISINEKNNLIEFFQESIKIPFLIIEIEFKLINLDTLESNNGKFNMTTENIIIQKIFQSNQEIKGKTFLKLSLKDLSDLPIDKDFIEEILQFYCYSQEKTMSNLFNTKAVQKYFNEEIESQEITIQLNTPSKKNNTIKLFQDSLPKFLYPIIQIPLSGSVNNKRVDPLIDPQFTSRVENLLYMHKDIFHNLIEDNLYDFNITDDNNIEPMYKLSMKYLKLIIPDFKYLYSDSMNLIAINKMINFVPYNDDDYIFGKLKIETEINSLFDNLNVLKFNQVLNINIIPQYISDIFNLQISSIKISEISILTEGIRFQNKQLLIKWINDSYSQFLLKGGNKFFLKGINLLKENIIDYTATLKKDKYWIKFLDK